MAYLLAFGLGVLTGAGGLLGYFTWEIFRPYFKPGA